MTLEEAIRHAEEMAKCGGQCGEDHAQLAMWLKELQKLRTVETEKRNGKSAQNVTKEDLISRKAAIEAFSNNGSFFVYGADVCKAIVSRIKQLPAAEPEKRTEERTETHACDSISRQAAIDEINKLEYPSSLVDVKRIIVDLPSAQPTLYGYKIEHLAYIARVMQKEGVTAEYAVRTFGDISRASRMLIEELQEKVEKSLSAMQLSSAEPEIIRCKECLMHGVCRFEQGLGLDGYCSQAERRTDD